MEGLEKASDEGVATNANNDSTDTRIMSNIDSNVPSLLKMPLALLRLKRVKGCFRSFQVVVRYDFLPRGTGAWYRTT